MDIICLASYHGRGGAQNNAARLVRAFRDRGYASTLIFLKEREPAVTFEGIDNCHVLSDRAGALGMGQAYVRLRGIVRRMQPQAIIGFFPISNVFGALAARNAPGCRFVASLRNPADRQNPWVTPIERAVGASHLTNGIVAVSETVKKSFADYPAAYCAKMRVVHNTTPALIPVNDTSRACRAALNLPQDGMLLGCLGRLHAQKNIGHAISVLAALPNRTAILAVAGEGPEEAMLRSKAAELGVDRRVIFTGSLSGADVTRFYRALDAFLFPSIFEGFGLTPVEAMSQGCPVIASDIDITREIGGDGAVLLPLDVGLWSDVIARLLSAPEELAALRARGQARVKIFGDHAAMADGYLRAAGLAD